MEQEIISLMSKWDREKQLKRIKVIYKNSAPIIKYYIWYRLKEMEIDTKWII